MTLLALIACAAMHVCISGVHAAEPAVTPTVSIPAASYLYRFKLEREVATRFGTQDRVAGIAAQVHAESRWKPDARSKYAEGMAQFTPSTSAWLQTVCPEIGPPDPWDPNWSVRAVVCYDAWLHNRVTGAATTCDRWAMTFSAYNGGLTWLNRDRALASASGADSARWFDHVERYSRRAKWAIEENRGYVRRILLVIEPTYIAAGWPGKAVCA